MRENVWDAVEGYMGTVEGWSRVGWCSEKAQWKMEHQDRHACEISIRGHWHRLWLDGENESDVTYHNMYVFRDATTSGWKLILDQWIAKYRAEGRGAILSEIQSWRKRGNIHHRPGGIQTRKEKTIPTFWRGVMRALGMLKLELIEEETITRETARAEPIWDGQLIREMQMTPAMQHAGKKRNKYIMDRY